MSATKRLLAALLVAVPALAWASCALADGQWTTYIRAFGMTDLEAGLDSVWVGTANAGVLLVDRRTGTVESITRSFGGLSSNEISTLALDRSRRLWVGTLGGGLSRLANDGRWSLVNVFDGLPSDSVTVVEAYGDTVWIGTPAGLAFWNGTEISGVLPDGVNPSPFLSDRVSGIAMMGDSVWVATARGVYLGRMSDALQTWTAQNTGLPSTDVKGLAVAGSTLFAVSGSQVAVRGASAWTTTPGLGTIFRLSDDHGVVLASSDAGLLRWTGSAWVTESASLISTGAALPRRVVAAAADPLGRVSAAVNGVLHIVDANGTRIAIPSPGPVGNNHTNLAHDGAGVYVTVRGEGFSRLRDGVWTNWGNTYCDTCTTSPLTYGDVFGVFADLSGYKWFSVWDAAVEVLGDAGPSTPFTHLWSGLGFAFDRHTWGWSAAVDSAGGRWIGSDTPCSDCPISDGKAPNGIDFYRGDQPPASAYVRTYTREADGLLGNQVRALTLDRTGRMWAGFGKSNGNPGVSSFIPPIVPGDDLSEVRALGGLRTDGALNVFGLATYGDSIWVLSEDSLRCFRSFGVDASPIVLAKLGPLASSPPHPLEVTVDGSVWVAADGGVRVYHPGGTHEDFLPSNSPLAGSTVRSIRREPNGRVVWFVTSEGLNRYDPDYVAPPPPPLASLRVSVFPNPVSLSALGFGLRLKGDGTSYRGAVFSPDGRRVRRVAVDGNGSVVWDGRDDQEALVPPGIYFLRVEAGGRSATARVVVLR